MGTWVDIKRQLPNIGQDREHPFASEMILLSDGKYVYYGQYENTKEFGKMFLDSNGYDFGETGIKITHWMPMPEPPTPVKRQSPFPPYRTKS